MCFLIDDLFFISLIRSSRRGKQISCDCLLEKADGTVITKTRYRIPEKNGLTIELDVFHGRYGGLLLAEVEFATEEEANSYCPPEWFGEDVTMSSAYHNSTLSQKK